MHLSIIIPHRGPELGLWATIMACEQALEHRPGFTHEYITRHGKDACPPLARNAAVQESKGDILFFFDDHVLPPHDYFNDLVPRINSQPLSVWHTAYHSSQDGPTWYEYDPDPERLLATYDLPYMSQKKSHLPYRILSATHGNFAMSRATWDRIGGYWDGFNGYGGEEIHLGIKAWMAGCEVWMQPAIRVAHYSQPPSDAPWKDNPKRKENHRMAIEVLRESDPRKFSEVLDALCREHSRA